MKKIVLGMLLSFMLAGSAFAADNLVVNDGFEVGLRTWTKWSDFGNVVKPVIDTEIFASGKQSVKLQVVGKGSCCIYMCPNLETGAQYKLSAKVYVISGIPRLYTRLYRFKRHWKDLSAYPDKTKLNVWQDISVNFNAFSITEIACRISGVGEANFDDLTLVRIADRATTEAKYKAMLGSSDEKAAKKYFRNKNITAAMVAYSVKDYTKVVELLKAVDVRDTRGYKILIEAQEETGDIDAAFATCGRALKLHVGKTDARSIKAKQGLISLRDDISWNAFGKSYADYKAGK